MSPGTKFRILIAPSALKTKIESALSGQGFSLSASPLGSLVDLHSVLDSDILVFDGKSLLSLVGIGSGAPLTAGPLTLYPASFEAVCGGRQVDLTTSEFQLILILCKNRPKALSRTHLVQILSQMGTTMSLRTIDNHIFSLRKKLEDHQDIIGTIRGIGYNLRAN